MAIEGARVVEHTTPMTVGDTGFIVDRMGQDCAPLQFLRELTQNAIEAIQRSGGGEGEIIWDVDQDYFDLTGVYKLCIIDTGVGMTGDEMCRYINQLSASVHEQSLVGNYGVGAKIAAATRNHAGLIYCSWRDGVGSTIHLWRDPNTGQYGLRQFQLPDGTFNEWGYLEDTVKPRQIGDQGTKVVLLGNDEDANTMQPPENAASPSRWVARYLNTRYFRFPDSITVRAREGWENPRSDTDRNLLRQVTGQAAYLERHKTASGTVPLPGAIARWWVLKDEPALSQNTGYVASSGHVAALHKNELFEMLGGRGGVARLQQFGVIFGYDRVVIYVEPDDGSLTTNTARTQLLIGNEPLPWAEYAATFRENMPEEIKGVMDEVGSRAMASDYREAIRERLKQIADLFRFSRYRRSKGGAAVIDPDSAAGGGDTSSEPTTKRPRSGSGSNTTGGRTGSVYGLFLAGGLPGEEIGGTPDLNVDWVTEADGTRTQGLLEDRAAVYRADQNLLLINGDFRVFTDMVNRWCKRYEKVPGARATVEAVVREWFQQALEEAVFGLQALRGSPEWTVQDLSDAFSEIALTSAVMPRYHVDVAVKRALGAKLGTLKERIA